MARLLGYSESKDILKKYSISVCDSAIAKTEKEAVRLSEKIGFPVALKIDSPDISHKSDFGGVKVNVCKNDLLSEYNAILRNTRKKHKKARISGIVVQEMLNGMEIIAGMKRDPQFGPVIMFGLGGIFVEVMKDVSFRIAPISPKDAMKMVMETKGYAILKGARGKKFSIRSLCRIISNVSRMAMKEKNMQEIDLNPIIINEKSAKVADARIIINEP